MSIISTYVPTGKDHDLLPHSVNDDVVYEKDGEVLVGTVVEHVVSSQSDDGTVLGEKRSAGNIDKVIFVRLKKWSYVSGIKIVPNNGQQYTTSRKMPGLSRPTNGEDEHDTIAADAITDYAVVLNYKIFECEYSFLFGTDNMYVTDDEKHGRPIGGNSQTVLLATAMVAMTTSRAMSNTGQCQKNRKYISIPGFDDACWAYMYRKYWEVLAEGLFDDDAGADKRKREKERLVRRNVITIQNTATLDRIKTIERNAVLERIVCNNDNQVSAITKLFGDTFGIGPRIRPNKVARRSGVAPPRSGLAPATIINFIGALTGGSGRTVDCDVAPVELIKEPHRLIVIINHQSMVVPNRAAGASVVPTTLPAGIARIFNSAILHPFDEIIEGVTMWVRMGRVWFARRSNDGTGRMVMRNDEGEEREVPAGGDA